MESESEATGLRVICVPERSGTQTTFEIPTLALRAEFGPLAGQRPSQKCRTVRLSSKRSLRLRASFVFIDARSPQTKSGWCAPTRPAAASSYGPKATTHERIGSSFGQSGGTGPKLQLGFEAGFLPLLPRARGSRHFAVRLRAARDFFLMATELRKPRHSRIDTDVPWHERPDTFPKGRKCSLCGHTLSVYNPAGKCFHHGGPRLVRGWKDETEALEDLRETMEEAA